MEKIHVLLVEDEQTLAMIIKDTLEEQDFIITTAGDGEEGLRKFFEQKPDVLVADVMMPRMDGFEFVQMGRALLNEPGFVNRLRTEEKARCNCGHSNYCIARMYTIDMACHKHLEEKLPLCLEREIEKLENQ